MAPFLHFFYSWHAGDVPGSGRGQTRPRPEEGDGCWGWLPSHPDGLPGWGPCPPALQLLPGRPQRLPASSVCHPSAPNICRVDLPDVYFLFVLGVTQSSFFALMTLLYYYCLNHSVYLLSPGPATLPFFPRLAGAHANAGCFPSSPARPSPRDSRALLSLLRTSLGPDVAPPLHPLICLQGVRGGGEALQNPHPALPTLLPCPAL